MSIVIKSIQQRANKTVKPRTLKVISICSICGKPVNANKDDLAYRHGYKRYRRQMSHTPNTFKKFSQEDDKPCPGSGKEVVYKRVKE